MTTFLRALAVSALVLSASSMAEASDSAQPGLATRSADAVALEAIAAASTPDPYKDSASSAVIASLPTPRDRSEVEREAVMAAHSPYQNLTPGAFYNSIVPKQYETAPFATRYAGKTMPSFGVQ